MAAAIIDPIIAIVENTAAITYADTTELIITEKELPTTASTILSISTVLPVNPRVLPETKSISTATAANPLLSDADLDRVFCHEDGHTDLFVDRVRDRIVCTDIEKELFYARSENKWTPCCSAVIVAEVHKVLVSIIKQAGTQIDALQLEQQELNETAAIEQLTIMRTELYQILQRCRSYQHAVNVVGFARVRLFDSTFTPPREILAKVTKFDSIELKRSEIEVAEADPANATEMAVVAPASSSFQSSLDSSTSQCISTTSCEIISEPSAPTVPIIATTRPNLFTRFLGEGCTIFADARVRPREFFQAFRSWCNDQGLTTDRRPGHIKFGQEMHRRFGDPKEKGNQNWYAGVRLR